MAQLPVDIHPEAIAEAQAAYRWYRERNRNAAAAFLAELDRAVKAISEDPARWPAHVHTARDDFYYEDSPSSLSTVKPIKPSRLSR